MSTLLKQIQSLAMLKDLKISEHGYDELAEDNILVQELLDGLHAAEIIEAYPDFPKGPCILLLQRDAKNKPIHALWGIPAGHNAPAVLVTAYRPDSKKWDSTWMKRRQND
jgi:hypothetical protein